MLERFEVAELTREVLHLFMDRLNVIFYLIFSKGSVLTPITFERLHLLINSFDVRIECRFVSSRKMTLVTTKGFVFEMHYRHMVLQIFSPK